MNQIAQLLASMDDAAWEALGSKGLLRRAGKELEKGVMCKEVGDDGFVLTVKVGDASVTVPNEGPSRAKCTCGALGCCHHVIMVGLYFRRLQSETVPLLSSTGTALPEPPARPAALASLLNLDFAILKRWSGSAAWRDGLRLLASGVVAEIQEQPGAVVVSLNPIAATCRFLPGTGLDGTIVTGCEPKQAKTTVVAAVVALKSKHGQVPPVEDSADAVLAEEKGAPRNRAEVLETAESLLRFAVAEGLAHAGVSSAERFATLSVSAEGTNLPRLARILKSISDELTLIATRQGSADAERTLDTMAIAYALVAALNRSGVKAPAHLIGQHKTGYLDVQVLELCGITAFPWQARSGFRGITVLFWDDKERKWASWTEARNISSDPHYNPLQAFDNGGPWESGLSIRDLATAKVRLTHAKRNSSGRLSSTKSCKAQSLGSVTPGDLDFGDAEFDSWQELARHIASTEAIGLKQQDLLADWIVLAPTKWGIRRFDRVEHRLVWPVMDTEGRELCLSLSYSDLTKHGVERLEQWEPPSSGGVKVFGRYLRNMGELTVEPLLLFPKNGRKFSPVHVLTPSPAKQGSPSRSTLSITTFDEGELEESMGEEINETEMRSTDRWFRLARENLVAHAEAGTAATSTANSQSTELLAQKLIGSGLPLLAAALDRTTPLNEETPGNLLKAVYTLRLHEQSHTL